MTLQTHSEHNGPPQQPGVRRPVWKMASLAAVHSNGFVFIEEGPTLFGVALQAGLFVGKGLVHEAGARGYTPRGGEGSVRIVAVCAIHEPFVDAMLEGHGELSANFGVAAIAKIGLFFGQQEFWGG